MLTNSLKTAWKVLLRRKFFTFASLFGISFTLAVLMVVTALFDHALAPYPPETRQDRTIGVFAAELRSEHWRRNGFAGFKLLDRYARDLPHVELMAIASMPERAYSYRNGERVKSYLKRTDAAYWRLLEFEFLEGGPFGPADVEHGRRVAVINASTRRRFFGDGPALGRTLEVDQQRFAVLGVVPDVPILRLVSFGDIYVPLTTAKSDGYRQELVGNFMGLLLLNDPARIRDVQDEFRSRLRTVEVPDPKGSTSITATPEPLFDAVARTLLDQRASPTSPAPTLVALLAAAAVLFMLLPAVNLVNLNVSRILERASEVGVRKAFGASSRVLVAQFLVENVVLTLIGGLLGFVLAAVLLRLVNQSGFIQYAELGMNYRIFGWGLGLAGLFGLVSGVYPAWRMSRLHPVQALKGAAR